MDSSLLAFALVYILPVIPAIAVWLLMRKNDINSAQGKIAGVSFSFMGSAATFVVFLLLANSTYYLTRPETPDFVSQITIEVSGPDYLKTEFMKLYPAISVTLTPISGSDASEFRVAGFDHDPLNSRLTALFKFPISVRKRPFKVSITPQSYPTTIKTPEVSLSENVRVDVDLKEGNRLKAPDGYNDWVSNIAILAGHYRNVGTSSVQDYEFLWMVQNASREKRDVIDFTDNVMTGSPVSIELSARLMDEPSTFALFDDFRNAASIARLDTDDLARLLKRKLAQFTGAVDEVPGVDLGYLSYRFRRNGEVESGAVSRGAVELRAKYTTFRIGPIPGGVDPGGIVIITARLRYTDDIDETRTGLEVEIGHRPPRPTQLMYLLMEIEKANRVIASSSVKPLVRMPSGTSSIVGGCTHIKTNDRYAICELTNLSAKSDASLFVTTKALAAAPK